LRFSWIKRRYPRREIESRLSTTRRDMLEPRQDSLVLDQLAQISRRSLVGLPCSLTRIDPQRIAGTGHGHVKQAPFLLLVQSFIVGLGERIGIAQFAREG